MKRLLALVFAVLVTTTGCGGTASTTTTTASTNPTSVPPTTTGQAPSTTAATSTSATTTTTGATTTTATATTRASTTTTATPAATTTITTSAGGVTVMVGAQNFAFSPSTVTINVGDTVQWLLREGSHTTTSGTAPAPDGGWNQVITADLPVEVTFTQAGEFAYFCRFHPDFVQGTVVVQP